MVVNLSFEVLHAQIAFKMHAVGDLLHTPGQNSCGNVIHLKLARPISKEGNKPALKFQHKHILHACIRAYIRTCIHTRMGREC